MNKDFFKVEKLKSISVTSTNQTNNWKLQRETESGSWTLADPKPAESLDSSKVSSANYLLSSASFNDIVINPDPAELGLDHPVTATLQTFDDFTYTLKLGKPLADDNYPLQFEVSAQIPDARTPAADEKPEDKDKLDKEFKEKTDKLKEKLDKERKFASWTYKISKWSVDFILKERKDLLAEKKEEEKKDQAPAAATTTAPPAPVVTSPPVSLPPPPPTPPMPPSTAVKPPQPQPTPPTPPPADVKPADSKPAETNAPPAPQAPKAPEPEQKPPAENQPPPPQEKKDPPPNSSLH